ncbi:hypothetical protein [Rhizosphaericola mali]|uniref:HTH cro/C1-type domain-containing protein n=1 Tax=Rhizosphaericola mali TaxID=2545455 RepID=A0A5P2G4Q4_9BACT|nr:hypothetical protein [Rhizosphaericola mali]QES88750.1 hypothetical protein E0W69_008835 [Rhizosphaericola mali]
MDKYIGALIERIAKSKELNSRTLGLLINKTKPGTADIFKRTVIDTDLLIELSDKLDYDFFSFFYKNPIMDRFKKQEEKVWLDKLALLKNEISRLKELQDQMQDHINTQKTYILDLKKRK